MHEIQSEKVIFLNFRSKVVISQHKNLKCGRYKDWIAFVPTNREKNPNVVRIELPMNFSST